MKFKLDARLILIFCCLCLVGVSSKKSSKGRCMRSLHDIKHQLLECHGKYLCNKSTNAKCKCIGKDLLCNGNPDCAGGEDEKNCTKKAPVCPTKQIICPGGLKCATPCNNHSECDNGEDEQRCAKTCNGTQMVCPDGKCATICDNKQDCEDGRDETECKKKECGALPVVPYGHFYLLNPKKCYKDDHALLNCTEGYMVQGTANIVCLELTNGTLSWATNHGTCVKKPCMALPVVANGAYKPACGVGQTGDCAILVCNLGFCLYPESLELQSILCMPNMTWSTAGNGSCVSTANCAPAGTLTNSPGNAVALTTDGDRTTTAATCFTSPAVALQTNFWQVTFPAAKPIKRTEITIDPDNALTAADITVTASTVAGTVICPVTNSPAGRLTINCPEGTNASMVRIQSTAVNTVLSLCEVEVYAFMAKCNGLQ